jgi:hypothetical protein
MNDGFSDDVVLITGPSFHIDLTALDACHPVHYSRRLMIFRCASSAQRDAQLSAIKTGLKGLVSRCPILGGVVAPPPDGSDHGRPDWRTILPGEGLELVVRDLRSKIVSFEALEAVNFDASQLPYELLVPVPRGIGNDQPFAACKVQFSAINGGTILTFAMSHSVGDGSGTNYLTQILSEETRLAQENQSLIGTEAALLDDDRSHLCNIKGEIAFNIEDHPGYVWEVKEPSGIQALFDSTSPEVPVSIHISAANLAKLKADATLPNAPPISTHDAIVALIWCSVLLIRSRRCLSPPDELDSVLGSVFFPADARRHLNLPQSYIGNAAYQLTAELDLNVLLSSSGLQQAASAVRRAITAMNPAVVSSYMALVNEKWVDWKFMESYSTTGVAMGTDWTSGELYGHNWGNAFGPLVRYTYPGSGGICVLPKLPDGSAELIVSVMPQEVETLEGVECFGRYTEKQRG